MISSVLKSQSDRQKLVCIRPLAYTVYGIVISAGLHSNLFVTAEEQHTTTMWLGCYGGQRQLEARQARVGCHGITELTLSDIVGLSGSMWAAGVACMAGNFPSYGISSLGDEGQTCPI
jgi:hypothetical protein